MKKWLFACTALAFSSILGLAACSSDSAPASAAATSGGSVATFGKAACGTCMQSACASYFTACAADAGCEAYAQCLLGCGVGKDGNVDPACAANCPKGSSTETTKAIDKLDLCRTKGSGVSCAAACGVGSAVKCDGPLLNQVCPAPTMMESVCFTCEDEKCCDSLAAKDANPEAVALQKCIADNSPPSGKVTVATNVMCTGLHPKGADDWGKLTTCAFLQCAADQTNCDKSTRTDKTLICLFETCACEYAAYQSTPGAFAMKLCIDQCATNDVQCDGKCYAAYPEAVAPYGALAECANVACSL